MRLGGRASAAIEVLNEVVSYHRPVSEALSDWGRKHRFAGSSDRGVIGNLVYDSLRKRASLAYRMKSEAPRALVLGVLRFQWRESVGSIGDAFSQPHGAGVLSDEERARLDSETDRDAPAWVRGDYPQWLDGAMARVFGERRAEQGTALAERAPLDLRANRLKASPEKVLEALRKHGAGRAHYSPSGIRIPAPPAQGRLPNVESEPSHGKGWFEIQDEGSQIAALLSGARAGEQIGDICAGGGGKTLALAAMMENKGQIHAYDADRHRLRPIFERIKRAGARNIQVIPADEPQRLEALENKLDLVLIDAPCSGSGAWRRKPDSKWRLKSEAFRQRLNDQREILDRGASLVRKGGRLHYITCSILPEENADQVEAFLKRRPQFTILPYTDGWRAHMGGEPPISADGSSATLLLTPLDHSTDGFFIATLRRNT
jgi:16S rRNA (cytosine967-C5)-methyltransferase